MSSTNHTFKFGTYRSTFKYNIYTTYPNLYGLRMSDNIKYFESKSGRKYFATANEGDSKTFDELRVKDLELDDDIDILQMDNKLGTLKVINQ